MVRIVELPDYIKDDATGAIINTNRKALAAYKQQKNGFDRIGIVERKLEKMEGSLSEIRQILLSIAKGN